MEIRNYKTMKVTKETYDNILKIANITGLKYTEIIKRAIERNFKEIERRKKL